jgi:hypothetical protein
MMSEAQDGTVAEIPPGAEPAGGQEQATEFEGNSLLTKPYDYKVADGQEGKDAGKDDPVPGKPEGYALKFAEGTQVDAELLAGFQKAAHKVGIGQIQAQKLAEMYEAHAARAGERMQAQQQQAIDAAKAKWEAEIQGLPNFAQEREHARAALRQYGDNELFGLFDQTNLGSHPKMWAFLARVGKALAEPGFHGKSGDREMTAAEIMYPNQGK